MNHNHTLKEIQFGVNEKADWVQYYLCKDCDIRSLVPFPTEEVIEDHLQHTDYVDGCFGCKIHTLELGTGDAGRAEHMSAKKWDGELDAYRRARSEGIQPAGTTMKAINEAKAASDKLGSAFNAESMPAAASITKQSAKVMKETGVA
jgi:hypothetical protein